MVMTSVPQFRIGTRSSPLALAQAQEVRERLAGAHPSLAPEGAVEIVVIKTSGDKFLDRPLADIGGKGLFTKEIEDALLAGTIDLAVHSMKDVPTFVPAGLTIACFLPREDPRDAFFSQVAESLSGLPEGAVVGSASLRRKAQILNFRPDLKVVTLRGNVQTRLRKLAEGAVDATLLALAGLKRLGLADRATAVLATDEILPAVAQGAIGVECREDNAVARGYLGPLNDAETESCVTAERALLRVLDGSCRTPIAALAEPAAGGDIILRGLVARPDGSRLHRVRRQGAIADAVAVGEDAGRELLALAGPGFFDAKG